MAIDGLIVLDATGSVAFLGSPARAFVMAERQAPHNPDRLSVVPAFIPAGAYRHCEQRAREGIARWRR